MGTDAPSPDHKVTKADLENDRRDVKDLWNEAILAYKGIVGDDLLPRFVNVDAMVNYGVQEMNSFHKWRHDDKKVDKLRSLFMSNISLIEKGAEKLVAAASPSFPPASAIGTALTFVLSACKSVSADYDVVTAFFEDMNSFLQRVTILESRLPTYRAYQNALMDVFTSLLKMCAFATKFIRQGRFKKWIINAFRGEDDDLAGSRKGMDKALSRLQSATEFAILANTENILGSTNRLQIMQNELKQNQEAQQRLAASQHLMLETVLLRQGDVQDGIGDIKKLLLFMQQEKKEQPGKAKAVQNKNTTSRIASYLPEVPGVGSQYRLIKESLVTDTSTWIFSDAAWRCWVNNDANPPSPAVLSITGPPGTGKSHIAVSAYDSLRQSTQQDSAHTTCVTQFFFREDIDNFRFLSYALASVVLQISEQSIHLKEQLETKLSTEADEVDTDEAQDYWDRLIVPLFTKNAKYRLYMVLDGLDEIGYDDDRTVLTGMIKSIEDQNLKIKVLTTSRLEFAPSTKVISCSQILVTKEKIVPDLRKIVWSRIQNTDSTHRALSRFSMYVKKRIAQKLEDEADGLLYVEHMLRYFSGIAREGAVMRELSDRMPHGIVELFQKLLRQCQRRIQPELFLVMKALLAWISFCFRPLTLDESNALLYMISKQGELVVEEEVQETFSQFLQIESTANEADDSLLSLTATAMTAKPYSSVDPLTFGLEIDDGSLQVKFRERSMRDFFSSAEKDEQSLRTPRSTAHREIFLVCQRLINKHMYHTPSDPEDRTQKLLEYAFGYCLEHWARILPHEHGDDDNMEVCEAFTTLMIERCGFATGIEALGSNYLLEKLIESYDEMFWESWNSWSQWVKDTPIRPYIDPMTVKYWTCDQDGAFLPLAKSHTENWLNAADYGTARTSYKFARSAIARTSLRTVLDDEYEDDDVDEEDEDDGAEENVSKEEIYGIFKAFNIDLKSNSYYALGVILNLRGNREEAVIELEKAIEMCRDPVETFRNYEQLAAVYHKLEKYADALTYSELSLQHSEGIPPLFLSRALLTKGRAHGELNQYGEATASFEKARLANPDKIVSGRVLQEEMSLYHKSGNYVYAVKMLESWKPIERLTLFTNNYCWNEWAEPDAQVLLRIITTRTNSLDVVVKMFEEVIRTLDAEDAGAPLRVSLAYTHWRIRNDVDAAKVSLNRVLDSTSKGYNYSLTDAEPSDVAVRAINIMSDILFREFQSSNSPDSKARILMEAKTLRQRNLPQSTQITGSQLTPHMLVLARMLRKMGPAQEYQDILQQAFDICMENLNDSVDWNDSINIYHLTMVLMQINGMHREAEIMNSCQWYQIDNHEDQSIVAHQDVPGDEVHGTQPVDGVEPHLEAVTNGMDKIVLNGSANVAHDSSLRSGEAHVEGNDENGDHYGTRDEHDDETSDGESEGIVAESSNGSNGVGNEAEALGDSTSNAGDDVQAQESWDVSDASNRNYCKGVCYENNEWDGWYTEYPMYQCLFCTESILCSECHTIRLAYNEKGGPGEQEADFCCANGQYLVGPVKNWQGVRNSTIFIDGEEPIKFKVFLEHIQQKWREEWERFWSGH